jgi:TonB family protein
METLFIYLVKVNIALAIFYLVYLLLLKEDTFIRLKRCYFFAAIVFSLVYPLFTIEAWGNIFSFLRRGYAAEVIIGQPAMSFLAAESTPENNFWLTHWENIFFLVMAVGTAFFLVRFIWQLVTIFRIKHKSVPKRIGAHNVYHLSDEILPFSFFKWIFVNTEAHSEEEMRQILLHEQIHVRQWHSLDVMLGELLCIFFWWNPFVWLMKKEITINLEYLADSEILRKGINSRDYQYHLLRLTYHETAVQIVNNFNVSQLKQRIMMMNKTKSPSRKLAKYIAVLPLFVLLVTANSAYAQKNEPAKTTTSPQDTTKNIRQNDETFVVVEKQPEFPGGTEAMMKFLSDNIQYPEEAKKKGVQGRVICNFIVRKDGSITDADIVRGVDPLLDEEAIRVINSMPKWQPGMQRGKVVDVRYTLPIVFRLQNEKKPAQNTITVTEEKMSDPDPGYL